MPITRIEKTVEFELTLRQGVAGPEQTVPAIAKLVYQSDLGEGGEPKRKLVIETGTTDDLLSVSVPVEDLQDVLRELDIVGRRRFISIN